MNDETKTAGARLRRIEAVSRVVRYILLGIFVFSIGNSLWVMLSWGVASFQEHPLRLGLNFLMQGVLWVWYWQLAGLFHLYQRGLIFASQTIRSIKVLGGLCVINWVVTSAWRITSRLDPSTMPPVMPPGIQVTLHHSSFILGFFSFSIAGINLGMLLAGTIIVMIAWIMDEGRKIQEEQELTV